MYVCMWGESNEKLSVKSFPTGNRNRGGSDAEVIVSI